MSDTPLLTRLQGDASWFRNHAQVSKTVKKNVAWEVILPIADDLNQAHDEIEKDRKAIHALFNIIFGHDFLTMIFEENGEPIRHVLVRNDRGIKVPGWKIIQISDFSRNPFPDGIPTALEGDSE